MKDLLNEALFIYDVTVSVAAKKDEKQTIMEYMLTKHIPDVLKHTCFLGAKFFMERDGDPVKIGFSTHYYVRNRNEFEDYLSGYAKKMRDDFMDEMGSKKCVISRRYLDLPVNA